MMKKNPDYILREIVGETVLVPTGKASQKFNGMLQLSETAAFIWNLIDTVEVPEDIVQALLKEYDVDEMTARKDVNVFLKLCEDLEILSVQ